MNRAVTNQMSKNAGILSLALAMLLQCNSALSNEGIQTGQKLAFMGDSITQNGWESPGGYVKLVIDGLAQVGIAVQPIPAGISGHKSNDMLARLDRDVIGKKPDWMTLSCGVNDVWHGDRGVDLESYKKNITALVDQASAKGIKIAILTSTPIGENDNDNNKKLAAYNTFLRELAAQRKLPLADLNADFQAALAKLPAKRPDRCLTVDGVHMNPEGNVLMAKGILRALGLSDEQVDGIEKKWCTTPGTAELPDIYDARPFHLSASLGQYRGLNKLAQSRGIADPRQLHYTLWLRSLGEVLKAHDQDALFDMGAIRKESSDRLLIKIDELLKAQN